MGLSYQEKYQVPFYESDINQKYEIITALIACFASFWQAIVKSWNE